MSGSVWVLSDTNCKKKWEEQEYWKGVKLILKQARTWEEFVCVCSLRCFKYRGGDDASMWRDTIYRYTFSNEATLATHKLTKLIEAHLYGIVYRSEMATSLPETTQGALMFPFHRTLTSEQHPGLFNQRFGDSLTFVGSHGTNRLEPIDKLVLITVEHLTTERWGQGVMRAKHGQTPEKWDMPV